MCAGEFLSSVDPVIVRKNAGFERYKKELLGPHLLTLLDIFLVTCKFYNWLFLQGESWNE